MCGCFRHAVYRDGNMTVQRLLLCSAVTTVAFEVRVLLLCIMSLLHDAAERIWDAPHWLIALNYDSVRAAADFSLLQLAESQSAGYMTRPR